MGCFRIRVRADVSRVHLIAYRVRQLRIAVSVTAKHFVSLIQISILKVSLFSAEKTTKLAFKALFYCERISLNREVSSALG